MESEWRGWQPDPFGAHEFRFFADDGKPTMLVRDGRTSAYDPPPDSQNPTDFSYLKVAPGRGPEVGATSQFGYAPVKGGREPPAPPQESGLSSSSLGPSLRVRAPSNRCPGPPRSCMASS